MVSLEHYGASADFETLYREFGITAEAVVAAARDEHRRRRQRPMARRHRPVGPPRRSAEPATVDPAAKPAREVRARPDWYLNHLTHPDHTPRTTREDARTMADRLKELSDAGVSIWLDDLSRERLATGQLAELVEERHVVGVTTNPTIFASALSKGEQYDAQVRELAAQGTSVHDAVFALTTTDVRDGCDVMRDDLRRDRTASTAGCRSRSSRTSRSTPTRPSSQAADLWSAVDRPNVLIKIPATEAGLAAITQTIAAGISVNVTLIFALERYRGVMDAYLTGLEEAQGQRPRPLEDPLGRLVLRVPRRHRGRQATGRDRHAGGEGAQGQGGDRQRAARVRGVRDGSSPSERFAVLRARRRPNAQRPLWASTGVKNPDYDDTMYVTQLVAPNIVNTMPEATLMRSPTTARSPATRSAAPTTRPSGCSTIWPRSDRLRRRRRHAGA